MSFNEHPHNMGDDDGPLSADYYKRAVLRAAPNRFAIEFLPPTKLGSGGYSFGMRISPINRGDRSSISSSGSNSEYDVWRRWEDCLWFQEGLELEYKRNARQKKQRLMQGKGVKKNGFYMQDKASSWESLPPGPDPSMVSQNLYDHIPRLTKRGTVFRASMATVEQRSTELQAFVEALFEEDKPALIKEMRSTRLVTDFFGYWQRDADLVAKKRKAQARNAPRESLTPSVFSAYFSTSTPSLLDVPPGKSPKSVPVSPIKRPFLRPRASTATSADRPHSVASSQLTETPASTIASRMTNYTASALSSVRTRRRALSVTSSDSSSSQSDDHTDNITVNSDPRIVEEVPIVFGYNPQQHDASAERPTSVLDALPEEHGDILTPVKQSEFNTTLQRKVAFSVTSMNKRRNRNGQIFVTPPATPLALESEEPTTPICSAFHEPTTSVYPTFEEPSSPISERTAIPQTPTTPDRSIRESWSTIDSNATYLEGFDLGLSPSSPGYRQSMSSIRTFMTTNSANAVRPHTPPLPPPKQPISPRANPRISVPVSLSDFDMELPDDDDFSTICDAFPRPTSYIPDYQHQHPNSRPETPIAFSIDRSKTPEPHLIVPPSPTTSISTTFSFGSMFSTSTTTSNSTSSSSSTNNGNTANCGNNLSIKVAQNNSIIMVRVSRDIEFTELRKKIYNKFIGQEGVPLSKEFTVAVVVSQPNSPITQLRETGRKRSTSVTSVDHPDMRIVDNQGDWETVAYTTEGTKLTLRILDTPA